MIYSRFEWAATFIVLEKQAASDGKLFPKQQIARSTPTGNALTSEEQPIYAAYRPHRWAGLGAASPCFALGAKREKSGGREGFGIRSQPSSESTKLPRTVKAGPGIGEWRVSIARRKRRVPLGRPLDSEPSGRAAARQL